MYLIINTADDKSIEVMLAKNQDDFKLKKVSGERRQSEKLLAAVEKLLTASKVTAKKLKGIAVVSGPGGFTSVRIGVTAANALAYAWKLPVVGLEKKEFTDNGELVSKAVSKLAKKKAGGIVVPVYDREPNIG